MKSVIASKEINWEPKRTLPTISFFLIPYDIGILLAFQRIRNSCRSSSRTGLSCWDIMRIPSVNCGQSSPYIFCQYEYGTHQDARRVCAAWQYLSTNFLLFYKHHRDHIFRITIARQGTSSYLIVPGVVSTNLFISFDLRNYLSIFLTATDRCFNFGRSAFHFFKVNDV